MRYLRFFLFLLFFALYHLLVITPIIFLSWTTKGEDALYKAYRFFWRITFFIFGIRFQIEGKKNIPEPPFLICPNHQSYIDGPFFISHFPYPIKAMIKESIFKIPWVGQALKIANFIKVKRTHPLRASLAYKEAEELLRKGNVLLIFPEGTRSKDGHLGRFKEGACRLAERAGVPILPAVFFNSRELLPRGKWVPRSGKVKVRFLKPLRPRGNAKELCAELKEVIENALAQG